MNIGREVDGFEEFYEVRLPTHRVVCPRCDGRGVHDCWEGGFSPDDEFVDDDFVDDYMRGVYDRTCSECDGRNVVDEVDEDAMPESILADWESWIRDARETDAIYAMERRMGA